jgi:hypothetical protein
MIGTVGKTSDYVVACPRGACRESLSYPLDMVGTDPDRVREGVAEWLVDHLSKNQECIDYVSGVLPFGIVTHDPDALVTTTVGTLEEYFDT